MRSKGTLFCLVIFSLFFAGILFAQNAPEPHESELNEASFPQLLLEPEIFDFPDSEFVRIALKIQLGTASIQERRAWYRAAERYAPFQGAPPSDWKQKAAKAGAQLDPQAQGSNTIYNWVSLGPNGDYDTTRIWGPPGALDQGRATAVWTHMQGPAVINKNIIYLGFADGGVWKSTDGGENWSPLTDLQPTLAVGALDVLPGQDTTNYSDAIVYVGTGEGNFSQPDKDGVGVLKSTDGGKTWVVQPIAWRTDELNFAGLHRIRRLRIDTNIPDAQSVWIAGDGGVYHTSDGGNTWSLVTGLPYSAAAADAAYPGGCWNEFPTDFAIDTVNKVNGNSVLYAAFGNIRDNTCITPAAESRKNNGIYRSIDGGLTWTKISLSGLNGFTTIPGNVGRISIQIAPSNPKHIYVQVAKASDFTSLGIWDTLDATADPVLWSAGSTTNYLGNQGWYDITGAVDPTNENRIMVGGIDNWLSSDRGKTITIKSGWSASNNTWAHADHHHAIWVDANTYYDANDGGLNIGHIDGSNVTWTHRNGGSLSTLQFYGLSQSAQHPYKINAGLQDNGHAFFNGQQWRTTFGGDGGFAATDQTDDSQAYEEYVYAAIRHSDDGGNTWLDHGCMQTFGGCATCQFGAFCVPDNHTAFIANFMLDANNQNIMYVGTNYLYRNIDARNAGKVWTRISSDGLNGDFVNGATSSRAYISIVHTPKSSPTAGAPPVSQIIYVGTSTGRIWKTINGGTTWQDLTRSPLPVNSPTTGRFLTWIDSDPNDPNKVVITYSGWSNSTDPSIPGHVFRSVDGGASWTNISGALPDEPFNTVAVNPNEGETNEIYAASDTAIYLNTDGWSGTQWIRTNSGLLPHVSNNMIQFTNATNPKRLRTATHGRGIWELFKECAAKVTVDRPSYTCSDTVNITVQDQMQGEATKTVLVFSAAESTPETVTLNEFPAGSGHYVGSIVLTGSSAAGGDGKLSVFNADDIVVRYTDATPCPETSATIEATAQTNCSVCEGSTASGSNLEITDAPGNLVIQSGDGDEFIDNCEKAQLDFTVRNNGVGNLTNVRIASVTSSNPAVKIEGLPVVVAPVLAQCSSAPTSFAFRAAGLSPSETLEFRAEITSDELAAIGVTRSLVVRYNNTESDFQFQSSKTFSFETDSEGWEVVQGTFNRTNANGGGGGTNPGGFYFASSALASGACDQIRSPGVKLTSTSTLTIFNQYEIEPITDAWYDRANLGIFDPATGIRTNAAPSLGRIYLAEGPNGVCVTGGQPGWAGPGPGWLPSVWEPADLQVSNFAGKLIYLDLAYGTDPLLALTGFSFDEVTLTDFHLQVPDTQPDGCQPDLCGEIDDSSNAVEYTGGWHFKKDSSATNGGYHHRVGNNKNGAAAARIEFEGNGITYFYALSSSGGTADIYIDGALHQTLSYAGSGKVSFGRSIVFSSLGPGTHELRIVQKSGAIYVDGFSIDCAGGSGADATAPQHTSETEISVANSSEGALISRTVSVGAGDEEVSVLVEGSPVPLTVKLLDPLGNLIATGEALISGLSFSGLDARVSSTGTYTVQVVNTLLPGVKLEISIARTVKTR